MVKRAEDDGQTRDPLWRLTPTDAAKQGKKSGGELTIAEANRRDNDNLSRKRLNIRGQAASQARLEGQAASSARKKAISEYKGK